MDFDDDVQEVRTSLVVLVAKIKIVEEESGPKETEYEPNMPEGHIIIAVDKHTRIFVRGNMLEKTSIQNQPLRRYAHQKIERQKRNSTQAKRKKNLCRTSSSHETQRQRRKSGQICYYRPCRSCSASRLFPNSQAFNSPCSDRSMFFMFGAS